jgi:hypothetical protein
MALHQAGVADNVGTKDRRQFALLTGHGKDASDLVDNEMVEQGARNTASGTLLAP